ncbi:oligosaccharyl transferase alpha subunit [Panus rudis PR-1116 ss-1]|nr:oligosaccharyl transferase alpha subunit [Panus rudis PR-1116 ss-1]
MRGWRDSLTFLLLVCLGPILALADHSFENTAIVRTIELGGSLVHVTTTYAVKALEDGSSIYTVALGDDEHKKTSWLEVKVKGQAAILPLERVGYNPESNVHLYAVELPKALKANGSTNLVVETVQTHATYPYPAEASQKEPQSLKYETDLLVLSPYTTAVQRTKVRSPSPQIHSYTTPEGMDAFTLEDPVTKSGATLTYGPYKNIPASVAADFVAEKQKRITVHYTFDAPVIEITKLERAAEISHWGANLNIQDNVHLHNAGPGLKGHFSRLEYQSAAYFGHPAPHALPGLTLHLPPGIHDVYYYDLIGNVSTSRLRTVPSVPKGSQSNQYSILELRPRYPVFGGWNYSFTLGWDSPLRDSAGYDKTTGKYIVGVPVMTPIPGAVVDEAEVKIILPEGARDFDFYPPFPASVNELSSHITYLDTIGRPTITLHYNQLTDKHAGVIYVTYKVPLSAHLKKPVAVATALMGLFILAFTWKRVDVRIGSRK